MARLVFPAYLGDEQNAHWMNIRAFNGDQHLDTISIFIPGGGQNGSMSWEQAHDYTDPKLARVALGMLGISPSGSGVIPGMLGGAINPKVEVLYRNTDLRKFQFNFLFAPASQEESESMEAIIKTLRYHSAPELVKGYGSLWDAVTDIATGLAGGQMAGPSRTPLLDDLRKSYIGSGQFDYLSTGGLFLAPSEFIIDFYSNGQENIHLPRIARCVIERIDVNYTPLGEFSTFSNGHPVSAMLTLVFREMKVIDKANIARGGY